MKYYEDNLGNPMLAMTAANLAQNPAVIKGVGRGFAIVGIVGGAILGVNYIKKKRRESLLKRTGTDPEIRAAVDIYNAIPAGLKKSQLSFFNPAKFITDAGNKISNIWTSTDTENILKIAEEIHSNKLSIKKVYSMFQAIYGESLYPLLQKALTDKNLSRFNNLSDSGSVSDTAKLKKSKYALVKISSGVVIRENPDVPNWLAKKTGANKYGVVPFNYVAGIATGVEVHNKEDDTVFVELLIYDKADKIHKAFAWKGAFTFHTEKITKPMFRFESSEFNGFGMININELDCIS